mgnify:CR=1 FL=1
MLTAVLFEKQYEKIVEQLETLDPIISVIEWRVDALAVIELDTVREICSKSPRPMILTLRNTADGGLYNAHESNRHRMLVQLSQCGADYIDIEDHVPVEIIDRIHHHDKAPQIIRSYHNFQQTPKHLLAIYTQMQHPRVSHYKMVTSARSSLDSLRLLASSKQHLKLSAHCMQADGIFSRVLAATCHTRFIYASLDDNSPLTHMLNVNDFKQYRIEKINSDTAVYALIGDPVKHSPGADYHNRAFEKKRLNALYIKVRLQENELDDFLAYCAVFNIRGLSVTMPLKNAIAKRLLGHDTAVNTVSLDSRISTTNTDGVGAINAIKEKTPLENKRILIIGSGGTAYGIISTLQQHPCQITVLSRNSETATQRLKDFNLDIREKITNLGHIDILISTTPPSAYADKTLLENIAPLINNKTTVMDVNYRPEITPLLALAITRHATIIKGMSMFIQQAQCQQTFWRENGI